MNYFVTGGTGFIGRFVVERLLKRPKSKVYVLVRKESKEAIAAYDRALATRPGMADAEHNKAEVERLLKQQEQQQEQQKDQKKQKDQKDQQDQQDQQRQQDQQGQQDEAGEQGEEQDASAAEQGEQQEEAAGEQQQSADEEGAEAEQQSAQQDGEDGKEPGEQSAETAEANPLDSEEKQAAEQWLRRIPDDPGGLLRRKFLYQYRQQAQGADADDQQAW